MTCRYPPAPFDWDSEMDQIEASHLTDDETAVRLASIDKLVASVHRGQRHRRLLGHGLLIAAGTTALAFVVL